jgi:hypothetical protein
MLRARVKYVYLHLKGGTARRSCGTAPLDDYDMLHTDGSRMQSFIDGQAASAVIRPQHSRDQHVVLLAVTKEAAGEERGGKESAERSSACGGS